jgi:DNA-binding Lrp family transcriptional regulator
MAKKRKSQKANIQKNKVKNKNTDKKKNQKNTEQKINPQSKKKNRINKTISSTPSPIETDTSGLILKLGTRSPIDSMDTELIKILLQNGRLSNVEIASYLNTSEATIRRRIHNLVERGFIRGFSALLDYKRFGQVIKAHINFQVKKKDLEKVANSLMELENSCTVYRVIGKYNLTSMMVFNNIAELQEFIDNVSEDESIDDLNYLLVTGAYKSCPLTGI